MVATTTNMHQLPQNLNDELAEQDKLLHATERLLERLQIPPSTPIQPATITPTINRVDMEISPNLALIDASKGSSDGTSSVTKHDANSTNEIPAEATTHGNSSEERLLQHRRQRGCSDHQRRGYHCRQQQQ
jgi:hypothetical protein